MNSPVLKVIVLVLGVVFLPLKSYADFPDVVAKVRSSVVGIGTVFPSAKLRDKSSPPMTFRGTGFAVGNGTRIVTNYHVIEKPIDAEKGEVLSVFTGRGSDSRVFPAKVIASDQAHDLAVLEFIGPALPVLSLAESRFLREGEEVAFTGFPIGLVLGLYPVTHKGIVSVITPIVMPALSSKTLTAAQIKRARERFNVYQLDATGYPGNSGSPVYDVKTGAVVAVINSVFVKASKEAMLSNPSDISYAIPVKHVHQLLADIDRETGGRH